MYLPNEGWWILKTDGRELNLGHNAKCHSRRNGWRMEIGGGCYLAGGAIMEESWMTERKQSRALTTGCQTLPSPLDWTYFTECHRRITCRRRDRRSFAMVSNHRNQHIILLLREVQMEFIGKRLALWMEPEILPLSIVFLLTNFQLYNFLTFQLFIIV